MFNRVKAIITRFGSYLVSESPQLSTSSIPYLEYIVTGSSVCGGKRVILGLAFFFEDIEVGRPG